MRISLVACLLICVAIFSAESSTTYQWTCVNENDCQRVIDPQMPNNGSLGMCKLTCGQANTLWPLPTSYSISHNLIPVNVNDRRVILKGKDGGELKSAVDAVHNMLFDYMLTNARLENPLYEPRSDDNELVIEVAINGDDTSRSSYDVHEGYVLRKDVHSQVIILSDHFFGYRNALVTLLQMIVYDPISKSVLMPDSFVISDNPRYPHRGVMIDTAMNFMDMPSMLHLLSGLSLSKINTVHWHITDATSFSWMPLSQPELALYGAFSADRIYHLRDIQDLLRHAYLLGIRIIPEIAVPAPMGAGWQWGPKHNLGDLVVCMANQSRSVGCKHPPCGQLNIVNKNAIRVVKKIYQELIAIFGASVYHLGGSNVDLNCWSEIGAEEGHRRWALLLNELADMIISAGGEAIVFSSPLLSDSYEWLSPNKFIIQLTESENTTLVKDLLARGYKIILSPEDKVRWDCGYGKYSGYQNSNCGRQVGWQSAYSINVHNQVVDSFRNILGGEGMLYSYFTTGDNTEERMLTQAAGVAERFWTNPVSGYLSAFPRIGYHSTWMRYLGFHSGAIEPYWCTQNTGKCLLGQ